MNGKAFQFHYDGLGTKRMFARVSKTSGMKASVGRNLGIIPNELGTAAPVSLVAGTNVLIYGSSKCVNDCQERIASIAQANGITMQELGDVTDTDDESGFIIIRETEAPVKVRPNSSGEFFKKISSIREPEENSVSTLLSAAGEGTQKVFISETPSIIHGFVNFAKGSYDSLAGQAIRVNINGSGEPALTIRLPLERKDISFDSLASLIEVELQKKNKHDCVFALLIDDKLISEMTFGRISLPIKTTVEAFTAFKLKVSSVRLEQYADSAVFSMSSKSAHDFPRLLDNHNYQLTLAQIQTEYMKAKAEYMKAETEQKILNAIEGGLDEKQSELLMAFFQRPQ